MEMSGLVPLISFVRAGIIEEEKVRTVIKIESVKAAVTEWNTCSVFGLAERRRRNGVII